VRALKLPFSSLKGCCIASTAETVETKHELTLKQAAQVIHLRGFEAVIDEEFR